MKARYYFSFVLLAMNMAIFVVPVQGQIIINEYSVSNLSQFQDNYGRYEDWIELHNTANVPAQIGGYYISDKQGNPFKWQFPDNTIIPAAGYMIIWASGRNEAENGHYHANFRLSQTKANPEFIVFSDASGTLLETQQLQLTQLGHSRGRVTNGGDQWGVFIDPTPGGSNEVALHFEGYAAKPQMNYEAGFYSTSLSITITTDEPDATIRYTTNGNTPTTASTLYTLPVSVPSTRIVQARVFSNNPAILPSLIEFNTYFINESHELVVVSVSANQMLQLLNGNATLRPHGTIEYFDTDGVRTTSAYGEFNKHGQDSWVHAQRSIDYIARDEMGYNYALQEKLFTLSDRDEFQRIIIRASGDDNYPGIDTSAHMRDIWVQNLAQKSGMNLDVRKGSRCVMYANGQFWGIYSIREKVDDHDFTRYYYNQDKYDIQFLKYWGSLWAEYGGDKAIEDWMEFRELMLTSNPNNPFVFGFIKANFDYTSLVDYVIINSFVVCSDWLNWNVGWWRGFNPDGSHHKWAYILWDEDAVFGHYINYTGIPGQHPWVPPCYPESLPSMSDPQKHIQILNKLRENDEVEQYYLSRYFDLKNTAFVKDDLLQYVDSMALLIAPEMPQHVAKWGGSVVKWQENVTKMKNFIEDRCDYLESGLMSCYNLTGPYTFTADVEPAGVGIVNFNSLQLKNFPWSGDYYGGVDVKLSAVATNNIYEFDYWELENHTALPGNTSDSISISPANWENIVAHFRLKQFSDSLVINEINYRSASDFDTEDWVEFYNPQDYDLDITGWIFKDDNDSHEFIFPDATVIPAYGYLVLCRDTVSFKEFFPEVDNILGDMDFGFSSNGELLRLYNAEMALIDTVHYQNNTPWPPEANGGGSTLELIHPSLDNALPESWMASPHHGTPGAMNSLMTNVPKPPLVFTNINCSVIPNPATSKAIILVETDTAITGGSLKLYSMQGIELLQLEGVSKHVIEIQRGSLPNGLYLFHFMDQESKLIGNGKILFQ